MNDRDIYKYKTATNLSLYTALVHHNIIFDGSKGQRNNFSSNTD